MPLPQCPDALPNDIDVELRGLAALWAGHPIRPRIQPRIAAHWDKLIADWSADITLPLLIRKTERGVARGEVIGHKTGRVLIPTDNSPASWIYSTAYSQATPSLKDIRQLLHSDDIPVAMVRDGEMRDRAKHKRCIKKVENPNAFGWKVCHKREIGLKDRKSIREQSIDKLKAHFREFLSPSNMFLVPLLLGGLGEVPHFIEAISREPNGL